MFLRWKFLNLSSNKLTAGFANLIDPRNSVPKLTAMFSGLYLKKIYRIHEYIMQNSETLFTDYHTHTQIHLSLGTGYIQLPYQTIKLLKFLEYPKNKCLMQFFFFTSIWKFWYYVFIVKTATISKPTTTAILLLLLLVLLLIIITAIITIPTKLTTKYLLYPSETKGFALSLFMVCSSRKSTNF